MVHMNARKSAKLGQAADLGRSSVLRAAGAFLAGLAALAAVSLASLWLGFDSTPTAFLYLIIIALLSLVSNVLPPFLLSLVAVTALHFLFASPNGSSEAVKVVDVVELAAFLTVAALTTRLVSRATHAAQQAEARARLLDLTHDAVLGLDADGRITYWNLGAEKLYGWTASEAIGRLGTELLQAQFVIGDHSPAAPIGLWQGEAVHSTRGGERILVDTRIVMERDERGEAVAVLATMNDITDRRIVDDKLRKAQEALVHVTRLTTLGEVTASIAHEVNQPLAAIANNSNASLMMLAEARPNLDEVQAALQDVVADAERASQIIERVRRMSRRSGPQQAPCRIHEIVADVVSLAARMSSQRGVVIDTDVAPDLPSVLGDHVQLEQVLLNLVVNAMDAMSDVEPSERRVEVRAATETVDGSPCVTISVVDRGVGLEPEGIPRLFEAFYSTKPNGIGLGLAISRSIVEAHGGRIWAEPGRGKGAVFAFRIPATPSASRT